MRTTTRRIRRGIGIALVLMMVVPTLVGVAAAHTTQSSPSNDATCSGGDVCLWNGDNRTGVIATYTGSDGSYGGNVYPFTSTLLNNSVDSWENNGSTCSVWLWELSDFGGWSKFLALGNWMQISSTDDNEASSHHWCNPS